MYTKKSVLNTMSRLAGIFGISAGTAYAEGWLIGLLLFAVIVIFVFVFPAILSKLLLKKDEREEVDGELYLWTVDNRIDYKLTINSVNEVPFKEYLRIRVNESARDKSITK